MQDRLDYSLILCEYLTGGLEVEDGRLGIVVLLLWWGHELHGLSLEERHRGHPSLAAMPASQVPRGGIRLPAGEARVRVCLPACLLVRACAPVRGGPNVCGHKRMPQSWW